MNECFEAEYIGYRFINRKIVKITNKDEISTIIDSYSTPYDSINKSICKAISMLSEISKKDYENCIKEAILATEECLNIILGTKGKTLGVAVDELFKKVPLNDNLKILLKDLYKYASDTNGIRHGNNKQKQSISFDEAKYILVISSATINYLISLKRNNL